MLLRYKVEKFGPLLALLLYLPAVPLYCTAFELLAGFVGQISWSISWSCTVQIGEFTISTRSPP